MPDSLRDRLKSLGVKTGINPNSGIIFEKKYPIQDVLSGDFRRNALGTTFLHEEFFPRDHQQGIIRLDQLSDLKLIASWARTQELESLLSNSLIFLDTETTGLSGGTGTYVFLVGIGFQTKDGFRVQQFFLQDPGEESAFLTGISGALSGFRGIVTYNGKSFDIPLLKARYAMNGLTAPFGTLGHIDLLPLARRLWKYRLTHRNLGILETEILGMNRTDDEIPGWMIPELYIDYCRNGDARSMKGVFYHNTMDIVSLAAVMFRISQILENGHRGGDYVGSEVMAAGELHQALGRISDAESFYASAAEMPMQESFQVLNKKKLAMLYKRSGNWEMAAPIFTDLSRAGDWESSLELAKFYEHTRKDFSTAKHHCHDGINSIEKADLTNHTRKILLDDFHRRIERLKLKERKHGSG